MVKLRYGYVYIMRFYNGDCHEMAIESLESLFQLSNVLNESTVYNDIPTALQKAIENSLKVREIIFSLLLIVIDCNCETDNVTLYFLVHFVAYTEKFYLIFNFSFGRFN